MEEGLPFFPPHLSVRVGEDETDGGKEVRLARAIAADDDIVFGREGLDNGLFFVSFFFLIFGAGSVLGTFFFSVVLWGGGGIKLTT